MTSDSSYSAENPGSEGHSNNVKPSPTTKTQTSLSPAEQDGAGENGSGKESISDAQSEESKSANDLETTNETTTVQNLSVENVCDQSNLTTEEARRSYREVCSARECYDKEYSE